MKKLKTHEIERLSPEAYHVLEKKNLVVWLENIRSMNNIGSGFRTSDAFLVREVILTGISARPPHNDIHKTALGAEDVVRWRYFKDNSDALDYLREAGYKIYVVEQAEGSIPLQDVTPGPEEKICVVFGNEVFGVSDEVMACCDRCIEIPQFGTKHSLNVSVSIGIVLWQLTGR